ncbi:hypothetical protein AOLI_G00051790 [Acnodon oligacanthus]
MPFIKRDSDSKFAWHHPPTLGSEVERVKQVLDPQAFIVDTDASNEGTGAFLSQVGHEDELVVTHCHKEVLEESLLALDMEEMKGEQQVHSTLQVVCCWLECGSHPHCEVLFSLSPEEKVFFSQWD